MNKKVSPIPCEHLAPDPDISDSLKTLRINSGVKVNVESNNQVERNFCAVDGDLDDIEEGSSSSGRAYTKTPVAELIQSSSEDEEVVNGETGSKEQLFNSANPAFGTESISSAQSSNRCGNKSSVHKLSKHSYRQESPTKSPVERFLSKESDPSSVSTEKSSITQLPRYSRQSVGKIKFESNITSIMSGNSSETDPTRSKDSIVEITRIGSSSTTTDLPAVSIHENVRGNRMLFPTESSEISKNKSPSHAKLMIAEHKHLNTFDAGWNANPTKNILPMKEEDISVVKSAEKRHRNKKDDDWTVINGKIQSRSSTNETWDCRIQEIEKIKKDDVWSFSLDELKAKKDNKADWSVEIDKSLDRGTTDNWTWSLNKVESRNSRPDPWTVYCPKVHVPREQNKDWSSNLNSVKHQPEKRAKDWKFALNSVRCKQKEKEKEWSFDLNKKLDNPGKKNDWKCELNDVERLGERRKDWSCQFDSVKCSKKDEWSTHIKQVKRNPKESNADWSFENNQPSSNNPPGSNPSTSAWKFSLNDIRVKNNPDDDWKFQMPKVQSRGKDESDWSVANNSVKYAHDESNWSASIGNVRKNVGGSGDWSSDIGRVGKRDDEGAWSSSLKGVSKGRKGGEKGGDWSASIGRVEKRKDNWTSSLPRVSRSEGGGCVIL